MYNYKLTLYNKKDFPGIGCEAGLDTNIKRIVDKAKNYIEEDPYNRKATITLINWKEYRK